MPLARFKIHWRRSCHEGELRYQTYAVVRLRAGRLIDIKAPSENKISEEPLSGFIPPWVIRSSDNRRVRVACRVPIEGRQATPEPSPRSASRWVPYGVEPV